MLVLETPVMERKETGVEVRAQLSDGRSLWTLVNGPEKLLEKLEPTTYPFVVMSMFLAAQKGEPLHLAFPIEDGWWLRLTSTYLPLLHRFFDFAAITATREGSRQEIPSSEYDTIGLCFSAGVDSFYSYQKMREEGVLPDYLINMNAGAHDFDRLLWQKRLDHIRQFAEDVEIPLVTIDCNFHEIYQMPHIRCDSIRNLSAALALYPLVTNYAYSTIGDFKELSFELAKREKAMAHISDTVHNCLMPRGATIAYIGADASRVAKTRSIADNRFVQKYLDVCISAAHQRILEKGKHGNCGKCSKCIRTMLTLDHFDILDQFAATFPIGAYRQEKPELLKKICQSTNLLDMEIAALINPPVSWVQKIRRRFQ